MSAYDDATKLYNKASEQWGYFRRWLALHPLTAAWLAVAVGAVLIGWPLGRGHWPF